ncbi:MAG: DHA2 family efflux MFS transporter permease subunit [Alphaproteobacteria bacterium]|nr:DHA2 family efflux MFS transporter permease subunit [Alphaproteobacteria bacterium]
MAATVMHALDMTIINVALPHMQGTLLATQDQISWVLTSYVVASAIMTPPTGILAARLGRKRFFQWSVAGFIAASMLCGMATSLGELVFYRILQGATGAALIPVSQAILLDTYPRERHAQAMAMWGVGVMVGPILGPTVGGYITELWDWRWIFFINLPVGIVAMLGIAASVPETPRDPHRKFDLTGFVLLTLGVGALQLMLDRGEVEGWFESTEIVIEATLAGLCFYGFVVHSATVEKPFLDLALLRDRNFAIGVLLIFLINLMMLATLALLPAFLQSLLGYPIIETGFMMMPRGLGTMAAMLLVGRISGLIDARLIVTVGLLLTSFSMWEMSRFNMDVDEHAIIVTGALQGFGMGLIFSPLSAMTFSTLMPQLRTDGAAVFSLMRNIGSSIGVSVMTALLSQGRQLHRSHLVEHVTPFSPVMKDGSETFALDTLAGLARLSAEISRQADFLAYLGDFYILMLVPLIPLPLILILKPQSYARRA